MTDELGNGVQEQKETSGSEWKEFTAPDGRKYYYNKVTKESKWTVPDELKQAREAAAAKASPNPAAGSVQVSHPFSCSRE